MLRAKQRLFSSRGLLLTRLVVALILVASLTLLAAVTGFGSVYEHNVTQSARVLGTLSLSGPTALNPSPPLCGKALVPLDTDGCSAVSYSAGSVGALNLGELSGADVEAASLTWRVTTTNPKGYVLQISNQGPAPVLRSTDGSSSIPDMPSAVMPAVVVPDSTHFGVAAGNPISHDEGAVNYPGSPWISAGRQGDNFRGIPTTGMTVAQRSTPQTDDPVTITFAAASTVKTNPAAGSYTGNVQVTASAL